MKKLIVVVITLFTVGCAVSLETRFGKKKASTTAMNLCVDIQKAKNTEDFNSAALRFSGGVDAIEDYNDRTTAMLHALSCLRDLHFYEPDKINVKIYVEKPDK